MPDVFDTLTDTPAHDIFDLVGPEDSPTPETDKQLSLMDRAIAFAKSPSPEVLRKPEEAVRQYVKGMVPGDIKGALRMMNIPTDFNSPEQLTEFVFPMLQPAIQTLEGIKGRAAQIREAEKTPPGSQERWNAGIGTVLDLAQLATMFKSGELIGDRGPVARPEEPSATSTPPEAQTQPSSPVQAQEVPSTQPLETSTQGEPNAQQPSNAQVQAGDAALGEQARPQGAEPQTGSSDNVIGETGGEKPLVEGQAPQEDVAVTQPEGGGEPVEPAAVSGAETPPAAEPPMGGASARAFERIYGEGEIPGGEGKGPEEMFQDAKARQAAGKTDPYAIVQRARTGAITPEEFSDLVAEHDRLVTEAAAKEGTPEYEPAYQAAKDFATKVIGPAKTRVSDTMRAMQIKAPIDYTNLTGFRQALQERLGREMTPEEAPAFQKVASDVAKANGEAKAAAQQTAARVQKHFARVKDITFEDAVRQLQEDIGKALGDCNL